EMTVLGTILLIILILILIGSLPTWPVERPRAGRHHRSHPRPSGQTLRSFRQALGIGFLSIRAKGAASGAPTLVSGQARQSIARPAALIGAAFFAISLATNFCR